MKVYLIKLKDFPIYVGNKNPSYALMTDKNIASNQAYDKTKGWNSSISDVIFQNQPDNPPHWFVPREKAKIWNNPSMIKRIRSYVSEEGGASTFSQYIVETDDNGTITETPLDIFCT